MIIYSTQTVSLNIVSRNVSQILLSIHIFQILLKTCFCFPQFTHNFTTIYQQQIINSFFQANVPPSISETFPKQFAFLSFSRPFLYTVARLKACCVLKKSRPVTKRPLRRHRYARPYRHPNEHNNTLPHRLFSQKGQPVVSHLCKQKHHLLIHSI